MRWMMVALAALAGCSGGDAGVPQNATVVEPGPAGSLAPPLPAPEVARYFGRWTGVEGMYLVVSERAGGGVSLEMQSDLDHKGTYRGDVVDRGTGGGPAIAFVREGRTETLRPTDGAATGLKYLADKTDCLTVKPGEGYCRD